MKVNLLKTVLFAPLLLTISYFTKGGDKEEVEEYIEILPTASKILSEQTDPPIKHGSNLTKLKQRGVIVSRHLSEKELENLICDSYLYLKRFQNRTYYINPLAKLAQSMYETNNFSSVLFIVAHNEGGYKLFDKKLKNYYLLKDDGKNCVKGEGPYSRFRAFVSVEKSYDYGCMVLLQKSIYKEKNQGLYDSRKWLEAIEGQYATTPHYADRVMDFIPKIVKILKKNGI